MFRDAPGTQHYVNGTPAINTHNFPDMAELVAYGHSKGLKMGWYFNGCGTEESSYPVFYYLYAMHLFKLESSKVQKHSSEQSSAQYNVSTPE